MLLKRCAAFWLDLMLYTVPWVIVAIMFDVSNKWIILIASPWFIIFRDILKQSPGRFLFNLYVVNTSDQQLLSYGKRILRNLTYVIWPIEFLFCLLWQGKRLGDRLAKSEVIVKENDEDLVSKLRKIFSNFH